MVAAFCTSESGDARGAFGQMADVLGRPLQTSLSLARPKVLSGEADAAINDWARALRASAPIARAA
jgi:hypothetical protein